MANQSLWQDNRSGEDGKAIGNMVLNHIRKEIGDPVHEKGTTFSTNRALIVGRVCAKESYLTGRFQGRPIVHFCNMSQAQHKSVSASGKKVQYLFISAIGRQIHYWLVPGSVIGKILPTLSVKASTPSSIIRITRDGDVYRLGTTTISRYHSTMRLKRPLSIKPAKPAKSTKSRRKVLTH